MAPVIRRSTVWRRVVDVVSAARARWRVSQTIRNRAEPCYFTTKEEWHGPSAEVKIEVEVAGAAEPPSEAEVGHEEHWVAVRSQCGIPFVSAYAGAVAWPNAEYRLFRRMPDSAAEYKIVAARKEYEG